ncbi:MAG: hypothetical protein A2428_06665, partial [Bdellovibrionales bacterium RIFOXYC1_FULL_54_43]
MGHSFTRTGGSKGELIMWKLPLLEIRPSFSGPIAADVLAVYQEKAGAAKKALPLKGHYASLIDRFRQDEVFTANHGSVQYLRFAGKAPAQDVLFVGMGQPADLTEEKARAAGGHVWSKLKAEKSRIAVIHAESLFGVPGLKSNLSHSALVGAFAEGMMIGAYEFNKHKTKSNSESKNSDAEFRFIFLVQEKGLKQPLEEAFHRVRASAEAMQVTRDWSNEPSNVGTPDYFASEAKRLAKAYGMKCKVLSERDAEKEKMELFLGVGRGAEREGKIVVLEYSPKGPRKNAKTIALVGKGITFDSGGISIKPSARMEEMKHDMTGAATVMGAILLAARLEVPNQVVAIMGFTENMPDGDAIQPGNVIRSRAGKTVEVINTDAEGRLILADLLDYAQEYNPDAVIDVATLTGAATVALGKLCCAIFGNEELLIDAVRRAGETTGERLWPMPLYDEYFDDLKSESADMKNSAN